MAKKDIKTMTDFELIQECLNTDKNIFSEIVGRYKNLVYSVVLRMVNDSEEANDLAQEVFIKIYKNLDKYYPDYKLSTWIIRIATNHVIDYRRKKKHDSISIDDVDYDISTSDSPESIYMKNEEKTILNNVINELPDMYKVPIVLFHEQGLSYQEIADITQEPLSKVKNRIFRGRKMLKDNLMSMQEGGSYGL